MKDKDPNEDEFNQDEQDNINEADDSFGLPDLDFNTLEEASEEETAPEEPIVEEERVEDVEDESDSEEEVAEDAPVADEDVDSESEIDSDQEEESIEEEAVVEDSPKRTYVPPKPESNAPKVIIALLITIVVSVAAWYFIFYKPQADVAEKAKIEAENKKAMDDRKAAEAKKLAEQRQAEINAAAVEEEAAVEEATFNIITEPTQRYYIVVSSSIDADAATDYGKLLASKGFNTALLSPKGKKKYNRLTIGGNYDTFVNAQEAANKLKGEFGDALWVLKY